MSAYEIAMLICFGAAWPFSIWKSYSTKEVGGKSLAFLYVIILGYFAGILHKALYNLDFVILLYLTNCIMVSIDILFVYRYRDPAYRIPEDVKV